MNTCSITGKPNAMSIKISNVCYITKFNSICLHPNFVKAYGIDFILYPIPDKIITKNGQQYGLFSLVSNNQHYANRFLCLPYECRYYILIKYLQYINKNINTTIEFKEYINLLNNCIFNKGFAYNNDDIIMMPVNLI